MTYTAKFYCMTGIQSRCRRVTDAMQILQSNVLRSLNALRMLQSPSFGLTDRTPAGLGGVYQ